MPRTLRPSLSTCALPIALCALLGLSAALAQTFISLFVAPASVALPEQETSGRTSVPTTSESDGAARARVAEAYGKLPLSFEASAGQAGDARVKFSSRGDGYQLFLTPAEAVLALRQGRPL